MENMPLAEIFCREADRLRWMADAFIYYDVRDQFLRIAECFDALATGAQPGEGSGTAGPGADPHAMPRFASSS
jgi:hypothetical protein